MQRHEELEETAELEEDNFELHRILAKMGALYEQGGPGLARSARKAYTLFNEVKCSISVSVSMYIDMMSVLYMYVYIYIYVHMYIYMCVCVCLCVYIYI